MPKDEGDEETWKDADDAGGWVDGKEGGEGNDGPVHDEWRAEYYDKKFGWGVGKDDSDKMRELAMHYVQGIQWCFAYYYRGCVAWRWYYPYHYAPLASDLNQIEEFYPSFTLGEPCMPFQQLLSVLPRESGQLLPQCYSSLMHGPASPISSSFPSDFQVDMEGKAWDWEAVTLIPFLDERHVEEVPKSYTLHPTPYTLHPAPCTLHPPS